MTTYGLTTTGFFPKSMEIIVDELRAAFRTAFGESINVTSGLISKIISIFGDREVSLWDLAESIYNSQDPDAALDTALDAICALSGIFRIPARVSSVVLTLTGTPATDVDAGSRASAASTEALFETTEDGTIVALTAWVTLTLYVIGDRRTHGGFAYVVTEGGTAGATGPVGTSAGTETDGSVTWRFMGEGTGAVDVTGASVLTGAITGVSGDINVINTAVGGWDGVINLLDATLGADKETNAALRERRDTELAAAGTSPIPAIRTALLQITGVTSATIFYNPGDITDGDGLTPHSVEAMVRTTWDEGDDRDQLIIDALFNNVAGGITTQGDTDGTFTDSEGTVHTLHFSRPDEIEIYVDIDVEKNALEWPADGEDQIKAAIVAWGAAQKAGKNAVASGISANCFKVAGVNDALPAKISTSPSPTVTTTIPIGLRELAVYDTSRITINLTTGVA